MSYLREGDMRARARRRAHVDGLSAERILAEVAGREASRYDIFLSQTIRDAEIVLGVFDLLTELGFSVFCDWIVEPTFQRDAVTPSNAAFVRERQWPRVPASFFSTLLSTGQTDRQRLRRKLQWYLPL